MFEILDQNKIILFFFQKDVEWNMLYLLNDLYELKFVYYLKNI